MPKDGEVDLVDQVGGGSSADDSPELGVVSMNPELFQLLLGSAGRTLEMMNQGSSHYAEDARRVWLQNSTQVSQTSAIAMRTLSGPHLYHGSPDAKTA